MLKKLYKKNGILIIFDKDKDNTNMKLYYSMINKILKKDFYQTIGYLY